MQCQICHDEIIQKSNFSITKCNHTFCSECIFTWTQKSNQCPVCRGNIYKTIEDTNEMNEMNEIVIHNHNSSSTLPTNFISYQNNFIHFLKENVIHQNPMNISIIYKIFIEQCINYKQSTTTSSSWKVQIQRFLENGFNKMTSLSLKNLQFCSKEDLNLDNHPSTVFYKLCDVENDEMDMEIFQNILIECLYLYHLKNEWIDIDFYSSLQNFHETIVL